MATLFKAKSYGNGNGNEANVFFSFWSFEKMQYKKIACTIFVCCFIRYLNKQKERNHTGKGLVTYLYNANQNKCKYF